MCTAVTWKAKDHYFGRNLDLEFSLSETVTVTPRNFPFRFRHCGSLSSHYAIIGVAYVSEGYPLYYDAVNEKGLGIAGLNFPENTVYHPFAAEKDNIAPFELIPWLLGQCATVSEAEERLKTLCLVRENFSDALPASPLHWIIADRTRSITLESRQDGLRIYDNPVGILTNNPPFDFHLHNLNQYMQLTPEPPRNTFAGEPDPIGLKTVSRGMGAIGMPGDASSMSRFVRAAFVKWNSVSGDSEEECVNQFFHILRSVEMPRGSVRLAKDVYEITMYSCCCNTDRGIYYYTTYDDSRIHAVDLHREDLQGNVLRSYPLQKESAFFFQN